MGKDEAAQKANTKQKPASKASAPTSNSKAPPKRDGKDFGDACARLRVSHVGHKETMEKGELIKRTILTLVIPPGVHVAD